ncbi:MAG: class I SAM-dependent methyltransferase [Kofleriaceae bacterium]
MPRLAVLVCLLLAAVACDRSAGDGPAAPAGGSNPAREQEQFDATRQPARVVEALGIGPGSRVADVGAGTGLLTVHLARAVAPNGTVVATDIQDAVLELLKTRLAAAGLANVVEPRVVGAETPGLEPAAYDAILLAEVDHYFTDPVAWLKAATASLKPTGRLVISNRVTHRAQSLAAAAKAGLVLKQQSTPVPSHFIAVFEAPRQETSRGESK